MPVRLGCTWCLPWLNQRQGDWLLAIARHALNTSFGSFTLVCGSLLQYGHWIYSGIAWIASYSVLQTVRVLLKGVNSLSTLVNIDKQTLLYSTGTSKLPQWPCHHHNHQHTTQSSGRANIHTRDCVLTRSMKEHASRQHRARNRSALCE